MLEQLPGRQLGLKTPLPNPLRKAIKFGVIQALNQAHNQGPLGVQFMVVLSL